MAIYTADLELITDRIAQMSAFEKSLEQRLAQIQADLDHLHTS